MGFEDMVEEKEFASNLLLWWLQAAAADRWEKKPGRACMTSSVSLSWRNTRAPALRLVVSKVTKPSLYRISGPLLRQALFHDLESGDWSQRITNRDLRAVLYGRATCKSVVNPRDCLGSP